MCSHQTMCRRWMATMRLAIPGTQPLEERPKSKGSRYDTFRVGGRAFSQHRPLQPFCVKYRMGNLALAHNGNLSNAGELRSFFENQGVLMQSTVDSELFLHLVSHSKRSSQLDQIFDAMSQTEGVSLFIATQRRACLTGLCSGLLGHPHDGQVYGRRP